MKIEYVHVTWPDADLKVKIWADRRWLGGRWVNIPSFEIFTSPDCRETEGRVRFNQPLYVYGQMIKWIELHFKKWVVTKFSAKENQKLLKELIAIPNANRLWEFSLTDGRISHITKFMGETLYDENMWGKYGNMHIALWASYNDTRVGNVAKLSKKQAEKIWFNDSSEHKDIVSTAPKTVTAILKDGSKKVIYKDGQFAIKIAQ
jgi:aminopeptidase